jgi:hypothetical protein
MLAVNERLVEQRRIVAYLDNFSLTRDLRQARLAAMRESHKGVISCKGTMLQSATGGGIAPVSRSGADAAAVRRRCDHREGRLRENYK